MATCTKHGRGCLIKLLAGLSPIRPVFGKECEVYRGVRVFRGLLERNHHSTIAPLHRSRHPGGRTKVDVLQRLISNAIACGRSSHVRVIPSILRRPIAYSSLVNVVAAALWNPFRPDLHCTTNTLFCSLHVTQNLRRTLVRGCRRIAAS